MSIVKSFDAVRLGSLMIDPAFFIPSSGVLKNSAYDSVYYGAAPILVRRRNNIGFTCKATGKYSFDSELVSVNIYSSGLSLFSFTGRVSSIYNQLEDITYITVRD